MKISFVLLVAALSSAIAIPAQTQTSPALQVKGADERMKADILVVVAHPDDEGGVTPYLARAIYDEHKRVAVVFATRGGSGGNDYTREHGPALADIREQEARAACAKLGITNVWFLDGKDTASQNVMNSLANWGHGANLEALVRIVRLTRPEVIISWLPGIFIGENHGDHQASGVLATEAFDLADDSTAFPAQVAGATKRLEVYLENLTPWQPKKLYFFSDADDQKQFAGSGPAYSIREVSPSQKKPYWRLAIDAATPHLTQFPEAIQHFSKMSDDELNKIMSDPNAGWWSEPMTLTLGKAAVPADRTADVFAQTRPEENHPGGIAGSKGASIPSAELAGPWLYYQEFRRRHGLTDMLEAKMPEIAVKAGSTLSVPIVITHSPETGDEVNVNVSLPAGWKVLNGTGRLRLPAESRTALKVEISTPEMSKEELKGAQPVEVVVGVSGDGSSKSQVRLRVLVKASALPQ
ncbi:MAG TPA: PIG-L family deacetylase [Candidatus Acidoferrum sp.]|jgi:LmbE family N-acetylglucosaminyl deacetylase